MSLPVSPTSQSPSQPPPQDCPACGQTFESRHPRRSVLKHIQSRRKKGDPVHIKYYDETADIRKRRRKDEMPMGSPETRKAEKRQWDKESKRRERLASKENAMNAVKSIPGEDLGNLRLYDKSHQQSVFYMQKHRALNKADRLSLPHAPTPYQPKLKDPSKRYLNPCLAIEILLGISPSHGFNGLQGCVARYFNGSWNAMYIAMRGVIEACEDPTPGSDMHCLLQAPFDWGFLDRICQHFEASSDNTPPELTKYWDHRCKQYLEDRRLLLEDELGNRNYEAELKEWGKRCDEWRLRKTEQAVKPAVFGQFEQWAKKTRIRSQRKPQGRPDLEDEDEDEDEENTDGSDREVEERGRHFRWRCPWEFQDRNVDSEENDDNRSDDVGGEFERHQDDDLHDLEAALNNMLFPSADPPQSQKSAHLQSLS